MVSPLESAIQFFKDFGLFDVVLPFLLVFTIVYAILEKTRLLGTIKTEKGEEIANKNLDSMVAFVIGLLVVATANVVRAINESLPNIILLLVVLISFLILISVFWKSGEMDFSKEHKVWYRFFMIALFIGVVAIFLNSIYVTDPEYGEVSLLTIVIVWIAVNWSGAVFASIIMLLVIIFAVWLITRESHSKKEG